MGMERSTFLVGADGVIKKVWRKVSVTGHAADVQRYLAAGADGVLKKPIDVRELFALVDRAGAAKAAAAPQDLARAAG